MTYRFAISATGVTLSRPEVVLVFFGDGVSNWVDTETKYITKTRSTVDGQLHNEPLFNAGLDRETSTLDLASAIVDSFSDFAQASFWDELNKDLPGQPSAIGKGSVVQAVQLAYAPGAFRTFVDPLGYTTVTQADIETLILSGIASGTLVSPAANTVYMVFLPQGIVCNVLSGGVLHYSPLPLGVPLPNSNSRADGYHGHTSSTSPVQCAYGVVAFPLLETEWAYLNPVSNMQMDLPGLLQALMVGAIHELIEAVTDPFPFTKTAGYSSVAPSPKIGEEVCDGADDGQDPGVYHGYFVANYFDRGGNVQSTSDNFPLEQNASSAIPPRTVTFKTTRNQAPFSGDVSTEQVLTFRALAYGFPAHGALAYNWIIFQNLPIPRHVPIEYRKTVIATHSGISFAFTPVAPSFTVLLEATDPIGVVFRSTEDFTVSGAQAVSIWSPTRQGPIVPLSKSGPIVVVETVPVVTAPKQFVAAGPLPNK